LLHNLFEIVLGSHRMRDPLIEMVGFHHMHQPERSVTTSGQHHRRFQGSFPSSLEVMTDNNSFQLAHGILSYTANNAAA
ncbi:MAG TPA: hypothetical protein VGL91_24780, partial [Acidobacteriota bacterium]